ncbi:MAG: hypothetical protein WBB76_06295 [Gaiellaceae bacterium]
MRRVLVLVAILGAAWVAVALADGGGPSPGLDFGNGIVAPGGKLRYSALSDGHATTLESVVVGTGRVQGVTYFKGSFGIPFVTFSGETGGLSRDGQDLVLATWSGFPSTRFLLVDAHTFQIRGRVRLRGSWSFDAISPDGSLMYLIHYLGSPNQVYQRYEVRAFNWNTLTLYPGAIVDRREPDEKMTGVPWARTGNPSGWAYTLYSRRRKPAFVHALDTVHRRAFCVDLPFRHSENWMSTTRLRVRVGTLEVRRDGRTIARMDTKTLDVR